MNIVILQHTEEEKPGTLSDWLEKKSISVSTIHLYKNDPLPQLADFDSCIILGGPMNVDQIKEHPWLVQEKKFLEQVLLENKKCLGICLGAQLLAQVLGATVQKNTYLEIGWHPVHRLPNVAHPALQNWPKEQVIFQWHEDRFELPKEAQRLLTNAVCDNQAFSYGKNVLGLQFHPESTKAWILDSYASSPPPPGEPYAQNAVIAQKGIEEYLPEMTRQFHQLLDNWVC